MAEEIRAELTSVDAVRKKLAVTVPAAEVDREFEKTYRDLQKRAGVPGFRRGHVPLRIVRQLYGDDVKSEVAREVISRAYEEALKITGADPINSPTIGEFTLAEGRDLSFDAEFEARPEIVLPEYKGLPLNKEVAEVTETDILDVLNDLRKKIAPVRDLASDRGMAQGDIAIVDFEGHCAGEPIPGGKGEGFPLEIGSRTFIPGFEDALVGLKAGEEKRFVLTLPAEYPGKELAGKEGQFQVTVKAVKERILPELDDDFARDLGEYQDLAELKKKVGENIAAVREKEARSAMKQQAVDRLTSGADFNLPPSLLEREESSILMDAGRRLALRGISPEEGRAQIEAMRHDIKQVAAKNVRVSLIMDSIARAEEIKVERADLERALASLAAQSKKPVGELRKEMIKSGAMEGLAQVILEEKTLDFVLEKATISAVTPQTKGGRR